MSRILFLILVLLLVGQERYLQASASLSSSSFIGAWSTPQYCTRFRGGQGVDHENNEEDDIEGNQNDGRIEDTAGTATESIEQQTSQPAKEKLKFKSTFRLLQEVREEVVSLAHMVADVDDNADVDVKSVDRAVAGPSLQASTIVGGAIATQSNRKTKVSDNAVMSAPVSIVVDANRVAPLSSRLLEEAENANEDSDKGLEQASDDEGGGNRNDVSKLWWTNVWTQQLSEIQDANKSTANQDSEEESEPEAVEEIDFDLSTDEADEEISIAIGAGDFAKTIAASEEDEEEKRVEVIPIIRPQAREDSSMDNVAAGDDGKSFVSSGGWIQIDNIFTLGLANKLPVLRLSSKLRHVRKLSARLTGLHGFVSGKPFPAFDSGIKDKNTQDKERMKNIQKRIAALEKVREGIIDATQVQEQNQRVRFGFMRRGKEARQEEAVRQDALAAERKRLDEEVEERRRKEEEAREKALRMERVKEIDRLISKGQARLQDLVCEKDVLQRRLNPLFDYTSEPVEVVDDVVPSIEIQEANGSDATVRIEASRKFKFPPEDLVEEYLDMTFSSRRIAKLNHTDLWKDADFDEEEDESLGDDLLTPSADAFKLYQDENLGTDRRAKRQSGNGRKRGGGSWLLRQTLGKGPSIGEKIGEVAETAAYKAVCAAVMSFLARMLSSLHGVNVMKHSDIRLVLEQAPDLPRFGEGIIHGSSSDYAEAAIKLAMRRKSKKGRRRSKYHAMDDSFVQRDAVTEMLLSHVQISAPLLKLFPLAWQRAFLGNIITLATAIMSDFFEGLQFQILGHSLTFAFAPITQEDMINHIGLSGSGFNRRRAKADEFEAAVRATAADVGENLKFLDRWHERALGSGVLRTQIANLIARIVLTLTDEILTGARMDLWSAQAGGPRMLAGLEYRTATEE